MHNISLLLFEVTLQYLLRKLLSILQQQPFINMHTFFVHIRGSFSLIHHHQRDSTWCHLLAQLSHFQVISKTKRLLFLEHSERARPNKICRLRTPVLQSSPRKNLKGYIAQVDAVAINARIFDHERMKKREKKAFCCPSTCMHLGQKLTTSAFLRPLPPQRRQTSAIGDPPTPLEHADVLNGWSLG